MVHSEKMEEEIHLYYMWCCCRKGWSNIYSVWWNYGGKKDGKIVKYLGHKMMSNKSVVDSTVVNLKAKEIYDLIVQS